MPAAVDADLAARAAVDAFAREKGRSVSVRVETLDRAWSYGVAVDVHRPAASLLKLPLAVAAETALLVGDLEPTDEVPVYDLLHEGDGPSVLHALVPQHRLSVAEILGLAMSASDTPCARWLLAAVGIGAVRAAAEQAGCADTTVEPASGAAGPLRGLTTADDAIRLLAAASDPDRCPVTARALDHSVRNSRIPLGANADDIRIAHKTGTLAGVAHDVAVIRCRTATVRLAFLTDAQHDTLVAGYEMGICTREVLVAFGLEVVSTASAVEWR